MPNPATSHDPRSVLTRAAPGAHALVLPRDHDLPPGRCLVRTDTGDLIHGEVTGTLVRLEAAVGPGAQTARVTMREAAGTLRLAL